MTKNFGYLLGFVFICSSQAFFKWENCGKSDSSKPKLHSVHGCEDKDDVNLHCKQGYKISIVKAFFGHGKGQKSTCDTSIGQNCMSREAAKKIKFLCQDKQTCTVKPSASVLGRTSCIFGLYSDLIIDYVCNKEHIEDTIVINSLELAPDPVSMPGTVNVSLSLTVKRHLPSSTKLRLDVQKQIGSAWIPIPCVASYGSCTYDNFCDLLRGVMFSKCNKTMEDTGIPCDCPIPTGTFSVPTQSLVITQEIVDKIPVTGLVEGRYWVKAEFLDVYDQPISCMIVQAELDIAKKKRNIHKRWHD